MKGIADMGAQSWAAIATAAAAIIALGLGLVSEKRVRDDRDERAAVEIRAQASKVSGWIETEISFTNDKAAAHAVMRNGSEEPIFQVVAEIDGSRTDVVGILPPGQSAERNWTGDPVKAGTPVTLTFKDNAGRWWRRAADGDLRTTKEPNG